jgi:hypothetical protein
MNKWEDKNMADDRMKNDQRNMGAGGQKDQDFGPQSPGRTGQSGGKQAGQHGQSGGQFGGQKGSQNMEEDDAQNH